MEGKPVGNVTAAEEREGAQLEQDVEELIADAPDLLWHYTSPPGLLGILSQGGIRATGLPFLNDSSEGRYLFNAMSDSIQRLTSKKEADALLRLYRSPSNPIAAACFCENGDLLSQWRGYSTPGGFSIGFDARQLAQYWVTNQRIGILASVNYSIDDARTAADRYSDYVVKAWRKILPDGLDALQKEIDDSGMSREELVKWMAGQLPGFFSEVGYLSMTANFYKSRHFREEREWRLLTGLYRGAKDSRIGPEAISDGQGIKLYQLVPFQDSTDLSPIRAIRIGPGLDFESQEMALSHTLRKLKYESVDLLRSEVPLRAG